MKCPAFPDNELGRLKALSDYGLGSDRPLPSLDPVVRIAARMFGMPVAAVNMIGSDHVFFAASVGVGEVDMRRDVSFCAHAINQGDVMVVPDATLDERFHDNPLVTGGANLRFYAGVPLLSPDGHALGALCVIDVKPHADFSDEDGQRLRELAKMAVDRLELRRIELSTERAAQSFETFARDSPTAMVRFDTDLRIEAWNAAAAALHGYGQDEGAGHAVDMLLPERERPLFRKTIARAVQSGSAEDLKMPTSLHGLRKDGNEFPLAAALFCHCENGRRCFDLHLQDLGAIRDETDALAHTDPLTALVNRADFYRKVETTLLHPLSATMLMIDLDGFKDINDTLGHAVGDAILREVGRRLQGIARPEDTVARIGGDEFAVLQPGIESAALGMRLAQAVNTELGIPISTEGHDVTISASCGVAVAPLQAQEALELIGDADLALFHAKRIGRGQSFVFVPALRMEAAARRLHAIELHRAVHEGEFVLFYQPQIRLDGGALTGAEALIRWQHPQRGLLAPAAFLQALESGPLAVTASLWVLDEACAQAARWRRAGAKDFRMGVNLCGAQFRAGRLVDEVVQALNRHGLPPQALELEITENIVLDNDDLVLEALLQLREQGVSIAFDDFGTGYASLSLLKRYPLSRIKIDRSFVQGMLESERDASVVRAILDMARSFNLETIAEGVETQAQRDVLYRMGCEEGQGYLFGKPVPAWQFSEAHGIELPVGNAAFARSGRPR